ncbi:MAG: TolC family protein [Phycisphaerales bacterium]
MHAHPGRGRTAASRLGAAATLTALALSACATKPGPTLAEHAPALDARTGTPEGTVAALAQQPWDAPSEAWDGRSPLTADAAVRCALQNNRALRRTLTEVERRRALYRDAQLPPNPTLDVAVGVPLDMGAAPVLAMVAQQIDWLWKRDAIVGEADAQLRALLFEAAAVTVATAVETRAAYIEVAAALEQRTLALDDTDVAARVLRASEQAYAAGEARGTAVNDARMNLAEAQNRLMEAENALLAARTRLLTAIGRGADALEWTTAETTATAAARACGIAEPPLPEDDAALHALVRERRLDLRAALARVEGLQARIALARASQWPSLMLGGGWERDMEGDQAAMVEVQTTLPIFNQGQFRVAAAIAQLEEARIDADALWQQAVVDARRSLAGVATAAHHEATIRDLTMPAYAANAKQLAEAVAAGERPALQLWRSEHQENHIRLQLARAQRDRALAALGFERALAGARLPAMAGGAGGGAGAGMGGGGGMGAGADSAGALQNFETTGLETME